MIKAYFAMPITYYDTLELESDLRYLDKSGISAYVPSSVEDQAGYTKFGMRYFTDLIQNKGFNLLIFRSFVTGKIGRGVATEAVSAYNRQIPVLELHSYSDNGVKPLKYMTYVSVADIQARELTIDQTRKMVASIKEHSDILNGLGESKIEKF